MTGRLGRAAASAAPAPHRPANPPPQHCNANTQGVHCIQKGFRRRSSRPGDEWRQSTSSKVCLLEAALCEVGLCLLNLDTSCLGLHHSGQFLGDLPAARQRWRLDVEFPGHRVVTLRSGLSQILNGTLEQTGRGPYASLGTFITQSTRSSTIVRSAPMTLQPTSSTCGIAYNSPCVGARSRTYLAAIAGAAMADMSRAARRRPTFLVSWAGNQSCTFFTCCRLEEVLWPNLDSAVQQRPQGWC